MIAHALCFGAFATVLVLIYGLVIRPMRARLAELEKFVAVSDRVNRGQIRIVRARVEQVRKLAGVELEAVSDRMDRIEERPTVLQ